jgi:lysylphosphatidylglycerol synthetase-like protein (DUF2156 family)
MDDRNSTASKVATALVAIAAWLGLGIQFYVTQTHPNLQDISAFQRGVRYFEYFTIITNLIVAISTTLPLIAASTSIGKFFSRPDVKTAVAVYIALVGIVYNIVLQGLHDFTGAAWFADFLTHDLVPLLYTIYWLVFVRRGEVNWKMPFAWTIYPLIYLPYVLIRGSSTGRYPYPFLDVEELGYGVVLINSVVLTIVFLVLGQSFVGADKIISRVRRGES